VRVSLSLLDQAIVQAGLEGGEVSGEQVRTMLGLADRVRILDLFALAATGDGKGALTEMRSQYDDGASPAIVMRDMLDICHEVSRAKTLGPDAAFDAAPDQIKRLQDLAEKLSLGQLTRIWQMLLKAHNDVRMAPAPLAAAEMALLKLSVAGQMPPPELAAQIIEQMKAEGVTPPVVSASSDPAPTPPSPPSKAMASSGGGSMSPAPAPVSAPQAAPTPESTVMLSSIEDLVNAIPDAQIGLKSDIKRYVRPIRFKPGAISFQPAEGAPVSLTGKIVSAIKDITGELWIVSPETSGGGATLNEIKKNARAEQEAKDRAHPAFNHPLLATAKLIEIRDTKPTSVDSNVIDGNFGDSPE